MVLEFMLTVLMVIVTALPLYFAVSFLKGKATIINAVLVNFITGTMFLLLTQKYGAIIGAFFSLMLTVWLYHEIFRLKWIKAFMVLILQAIIIIIFYAAIFILALFLGFTLLKAILPF